ncbi:hypothetical protein BD408DRAFT_377487 [Parasitella parasitica]|nr:hypothetical protein BD408DRAFT_377487 [Parasitella parasitica]
MQVLPAVLRDTFSTSENDLLGKTTCCLEVVGHLASLLYMRGVKQTNVEQLINLIRDCTSNLSALLLDLDNHCIKIQLKEPPLFSIQPKVHFLFHLEDDIRRFAMPVHYETEHGEQYNKFIREAILLTNRHNPSKDVALKLAKQFVVRHLVNGGSFTVTKNDGSERHDPVLAHQ